MWSLARRMGVVHYYASECGLSLKVGVVCHSDGGCGLQVSHPLEQQREGPHSEEC